MAHIPTPEGLPGIRGLFAFRPETALPLNELVDQLLQAPGTLTRGERELIATYVSARNDCYYCQTIHGAVAAAHLDGNEELVAQVKLNFTEADLSPKLKALLGIAGKVQKSGKQVTDQDIAAARAEGASDIEIHDTVLIAAAFCMFNRYVDGLGTWAPDDRQWYRDRGRKVAEQGYMAASKQYIPQLSEMTKR
jgi:uncharacterized peroxidase-related enzyme